MADPPRIVNFPTKDLLAPEDVRFSRQNALKLPCDAVGSNLQWTWKHNGTAITTGGKFTVGADGTLYGSYLESAQSGNYQCFVRDTVTGIETFSRKIQVAVTGKESFQYHWYNRSKQIKKKNNKAQGCAFNAELEKKKMNSSLSFGQGALTFGLSKAISCLSKSVIMILLEGDLAETFSQVSFKSYLPSKNISFPLRTTGFDFF